MILAAALFAASMCRLADERVERVIAAQAKELHGTEYCQFRLYDAIDDFDGDGIDDFAVTFNVEGSGGGGMVDSFLFWCSCPHAVPMLRRWKRRPDRAVRLLPKQFRPMSIAASSSASSAGCAAMRSVVRPATERFSSASTRAAGCFG